MRGDGREIFRVQRGNEVTEPFSVSRRAGGDLLNGNAGDWLLQYAPGDYGLIEDARFQRVYRRAVE